MSTGDDTRGSFIEGESMYLLNVPNTAPLPQAARSWTWTLAPLLCCAALVGRTQNADQVQLQCQMQSRISAAELDHPDGHRLLCTARRIPVAFALGCCPSIAHCSLLGASLSRKDLE